MIRQLVLLLGLVSLAAAQPRVAHPEMLVSTEWLAAHLNDPQVVVLHFADSEEDFKAGHIPGARPAFGYTIFKPVNGVESELKPVEELVKNFEELGISNDSRIVIYTTDWPPMAPRVYFTLDYLGLGDRAALLDGGIEKWKAENRQVATDNPKPKRGKITPHPHPEILATLDEVKAASESSSGPMIVDSRPDRRYVAGHIPGAIHLYWQQNVGEGDKNELLDAEDMRKNFVSAGAKPGAKLITYCEIGWQASHDYFTAKYLGYDVKMYDGSYNEWNDIKHMPVVKGDKPR